MTLFPEETASFATEIVVTCLAMAAICAPMSDIPPPPEERSWETAKTLAEALPFIQVYDLSLIHI